MTTIQLIIVCATVLLLALIAAGALERGRGGESAPGPTLAGRTVVVNTPKPDDQSVRGVVVSHHADRITLREAEYLHASGAQPAAGLVHLPLPVSSIQEVDGLTPRPAIGKPESRRGRGI